MIKERCTVFTGNASAMTACWLPLPFAKQQFFPFHMHEGQDNQLHYPILHCSVYWEENLKSPSDTQVPHSGDWAHENPL